MFRCLLILAFFLVLGCMSLPKGAPVAALPEQHSVVRGQLVLHSDFPLPKEHRLLTELVQQRKLQADVLLLSPSEEPIHVYLFHSPESFAAYIAERFPQFPVRRAFFVETDTQLAVYAHWGERVAEDLRHEVAHGYLHAAVREIPLWLDEGLAEYFEVPRTQNGFNPTHAKQLALEIQQNDWRPNLQRLETLSSVAEMNQLDYAESWAWVYFLLNTTDQRRALLQQHLAALRDDPQHAAPLSVAIRGLHFEPDRTLLDYLAGLQ